MKLDSKIYVAWHRGLVWSAIMRELESKLYQNIITRKHSELDLTNQREVALFVEQEKPEYVFLAAAKVWGIWANSKYPAEFIYQNLQIQSNIIHQSYISGVKKLLFLWSSCIYPKFCPQPMKEDYLLTGELESTNEPYAIAKIAGIKMCQSYNRQYGTNFIACMPTNLYGPNDNFDLENSHVFPAIIRKIHEAKKNNQFEVVLRWDGSPKREFLHVDDMASACIFLMQNFNPTSEQNINWDIFLNIGTWEDISILDYANLVKDIVWYTWNIIRDKSKPNGTPRKILDVSKINNIWRKHKISIKDGIWITYRWFLENYE